MTLPVSGIISLLDITTEFGRGTQLSKYEGVQWWTDAGGTGVFDKPILFSDFYGKRATSSILKINITGEQAGLNLTTILFNNGWAGGPAEITIAAGALIYATSPNNPAIHTGGSLNGNVTLINKGIIGGAGGAGGRGASGSANSVAGGAGGSAIEVWSNISIDNKDGVIASGGGGGGGGASTSVSSNGLYTLGGGGGGGGSNSRGSASGAVGGSSGGTGTRPYRDGEAGGNSSGFQFGAGGGGGELLPSAGGWIAYGGQGGAGGGGGQNGGSGGGAQNGSTPRRSASSGGFSNKAVARYVGTLTWINKGTIFGTSD